MLRKIDIPSPYILQRIDRHLLLHQPAIWASRIHVVLFYGLALLAALVLHALVRPISESHLPHPDHQFLLTAIPSLLAFGPFAYHLSLFNVEKSFGEKPRLFGLKQQLSLLCCIILLALIPYLYASIISYRIGEVRSNKELVSDVKMLNEGDVYFPDYAYVFQDNVNKDGNYNFQMHKYRLYAFVYTPNFKINQSASQLKEIHSEADLNMNNRTAYAAQFIETFNRYSDRKIDLEPQQAIDAFFEGKVPVLGLKKSKIQVEDRIQQIIKAKSGNFAFQDASALRQLGIFLLSLSMILLLFLKMHIKDFSTGLVLGGISSMLGLAAIEWIADWFSIETGKILFPLLVGLFVICIGAISGRGIRKISNRWKSILLMWTSCMIPFIPLVAVSTEGYVYEKTAYSLLFMGFATLLLAWHVYINQKFSFFLSQPTEK